MQDKPGMLPEGSLFLFILQCIVSFFARPDPYDVLDIVNEYLAVARMSSVQGFLHRVDDSLDGDPAHDDVDLDLGKEPRFHRSAEACILHTAVKYTPLCMVISCFTKNLTRLCR